MRLRRKIMSFAAASTVLATMATLANNQVVWDFASQKVSTISGKNINIQEEMQNLPINPQEIKKAYEQGVIEFEETTGMEFPIDSSSETGSFIHINTKYFNFDEVKQVFNTVSQKTDVSNHSTESKNTSSEETIADDQIISSLVRSFEELEKEDPERYKKLVEAIRKEISESEK